MLCVVCYGVTRCLVVVTDVTMEFVAFIGMI